MFNYIDKNMNFALWLFEAEYTDVRNTYSDLMDYLEKTPEDVYVNFGDNPKNPFVPAKKSSHHDPVGIYGFPKKYMVNTKQTANPGFWSSPYITVFKLKPGAKVLDLDTLSKDKALEYLDTMGIKDYIDKPYHRSLVNEGGGALLWHTMEKYIALSREHKNTAWNLLFKKIGIDAVVDNNGVIHSNEPEQIVLLNPSMGEVVKTVERPFNSFIRRIRQGIYDVLKKLGDKYFGQYHVESSRRGSSDFTKKYPAHELASRPDINMDIISDNPEVPLKISVSYAAYNGELRGYINRFSPFDRLFDTKVEKPFGLGYSHIMSTATPNFAELESKLDTAMSEITSKPLSGSIKEGEKLNDEILDQFDSLNFKTKFVDGDFKSIAQLMLGDIPANLIFNLSTYDKDEFKVYPTIKWNDKWNYRGGRDKYTLQPIAIKDMDDAKNFKTNLKQSIKEMLERLNKDSDYQYTYRSLIDVFEKLLKVI